MCGGGERKGERGREEEGERESALVLGSSEWRLANWFSKSLLFSNIPNMSQETCFSLVKLQSLGSE